MQCTKPIRIHPKGHPEHITVGCGKCLSCRVQKRKEWSMRLWHELGYHSKSVFVTLTYDDYHLPDDYSLKLRHLQLYIKRLRKDITSRGGDKIKYFACGEYGTHTQRPHYHAIIYGLGLDRTDKELMMRHWQYCDWTVDSIRRKSFGAVTPQSINYVAGYIHSKLSGQAAIEAYNETGRESVFRILSQGLGRQFAIDNQSQIDANKCITQHGVKYTIPRYYINKLGIDTESLKEQALIVEAEQVEYYTGLVTTREGLLTAENIGAEKLYRNGVKRARIQRDRTLKAKLALKDSKI